MAQSKTAVNAKAAPAEGSGLRSDTSLVPGQEIQDLGGPTPEGGIAPTANSPRLDAAKGANESKALSTQRLMKRTLLLP